MLKWIARGALALVATLTLAGVGAFMWASAENEELLGRSFEVHEVDFPIPFPLSEAELEGLREERQASTLDGVDLDAIALERALARGQHLIEARYVCIECHGQDLGGGTMVDDPAIGQLLGPNLTAGRGSRTLDYAPRDWDRIVRHGVLPSGHPGAMPAEDFRNMSDRELSDIVAYIRTFPPVDAEVPQVSLGPLGTMLMATGNIPLAADVITDHQSAHLVEPPTTEATPTFGRHVAAICTGCHLEAFTGGPIKAGPPDWLPAANLTPHEEGLAGWSYEDFKTAMLEGLRPDGSEIGMPMTLITPYANRMEEVELRALWAYLSSLPPATSSD